MTDLEKARGLLHSGHFGNCVLYSGDIIHTSKGRGISPMLEFIAAELDLKDFSAADTIAGRAGALLFVYAGVEAVYADVMSRGAVNIFEQYDVRYVYGELTDEIKNRSGDGICPMELAVMYTDQPAKAYSALKQAVNNTKLHFSNGV
jgi:hypothetical protein